MIKLENRFRYHGYRVKLDNNSYLGYICLALFHGTTIATVTIFSSVTTVMITSAALFTLFTFATMIVRLFIYFLFALYLTTSSVAQTIYRQMKF
jgi:uncharacterized membrane protein YgaE (UPF0421/DUF939 family)